MRASIGKCGVSYTLRDKRVSGRREDSNQGLTLYCYLPLAQKIELIFAFSFLFYLASSCWIKYDFESHANPLPYPSLSLFIYERWNRNKENEMQSLESGGCHDVNSRHVLLSASLF